MENYPLVTIIIPTYNRVDCLKLFIDKCMRPYKGSFFRFEIHDSSSNDLTEKLFKIFLTTPRNYEFQYYRYNPSLSVDDKVLKAVKEAKTKFFYIFGDGNLMNFNNFERKLINSKFQSFDIIDVESKNRINHLGFDSNAKIDVLYQINDPNEYCKYWSHFTYWGASIINKNFFMFSLTNEILSKYRTNKLSLWTPSCIYEAIAHQYALGKNAKMGVIYSDDVSSNPFKKGHSWTTGEVYYQVVFAEANDSIMALPSLYDSKKMMMIRIFRDDALANKKFLMTQRINGTLCFKFLYKYKKQIKFVHGYYWYMFVLCCIPSFSLKILKIIYHKIKYQKFNKQTTRFSNVLL